MNEARATLKKMHRSGVDTSLVLRVDQILGGDLACHCGEPAVLVVTSEPDGDPGPTCLEHAMDWIDFTVRFTRELFTPKEDA